MHAVQMGAFVAKCGGVAELPSCKLCVEYVLHAVWHEIHNRFDVPAGRSLGEQQEVVGHLHLLGGE